MPSSSPLPPSPGALRPRPATTGAKSVSIHVVKTPNGPSAATNSGASRTARWKGSTVGIPCTSASARARRARSIASARVDPVTMILAIIESKAPETVSPWRTPASTRTPGPEGR